MEPLFTASGWCSGMTLGDSYAKPKNQPPPHAQIVFEIRDINESVNQYCDHNAYQNQIHFAVFRILHAAIIP